MNFKESISFAIGGFIGYSMALEIAKKYSHLFIRNTEFRTQIGTIKL